MLHKRVWITMILILLTTAVLALTACGNTTQPASPEAPITTGTQTEQQPAETSGGVVQLQLMGWASSDAENARLQQIINSFNEQNDNIQVQLNIVPDYDTKLQTSMAGGSPPDVFYIDSFKLPDYVKANVLSATGDDLENIDDFYPNLRDAFTIDNTFYCPPKDFSTLALQYNKDLFDAAGLDYPTAEWTWDDLRSAAEQLTNADENVYGMVLSPDIARWIAFLYQAGGTVANDDFSAMTLDTPEAKESLEFYVGLVRDGYAAQPADLDSGWPGEAFGKGQAAMAMEGNWIVPYLRDQFPDLNYGLEELPAGPAGKATMSFTVCYGVPTGTQNRAEAVELVNFLTGESGMKEWTDLGLAMPTRASLRAGWLAQYPDLEPFLNGADYAYPWQFRPGFQDVSDTINAGLQQAFAGAMTAEQVLQDAQEVGEEVLSQGQ